MQANKSGTHIALKRQKIKEKWRFMELRGSGSGGEGGIRTHVTVTRKPHFECGAFDLSATSPRGRIVSRRGAGPVDEARG